MHFEFAPVSALYIEKTVKSFKNKTCHINEIPVAVIKRIIHHIAPILSVLITNCVQSSVYPESLKKARVIPVYKNGSKQLATNYRPISVLSNFNKIFETIIHNKMLKFVERCHLLSEKQYGFRRKSSTTCAILDLINRILIALQNKEFAIAIFLDLKKAFDCVHRSILLMKLEKYGFRGEFLLFLRSYLDSRVQFVNINNCISSTMTVIHGVPQGSILGPLFFILYINDISLISPLLYKVLFADDTVILRSGLDFNELTTQLQTELNVLIDWLNYNKLAVNVSKTKCIVFSSGKAFNEPDIRIQNVKIEIVSDYKYLGLIIDERLSFNTHVKQLKGKLSYYCGLIYSLRNYLPKEALLSIYYSLVYQHIVMHIIIWGNTSVSNLNMIQIAQNKIIRSMYKNYHHYYSTNDLFEILNLHQISKIYKIRVAIFMYKWINDYDYTFLNDVLNEVMFEHDHRTRTNTKLRLPFPRLELHKQFVTYQGIKIWNELPDEFKNVKSCHTFKKRIMNYFST